MVKNVFKVLFSNAILILVGLCSSLLFPMLMSTDDYSFYQKYLLYVSYINICHIGIPSGMYLNYAGKDYRETDKKQYKSEVFLIYVVLLIGTNIGFLFAGVSQSQMVLLVTISIIPQCVISAFQALYQSWGKYTGYAIVNALPKTLLIIFFVFAYWGLNRVSGFSLVVLLLVINWGVTIYFTIDFFRFVKGYRCNKILSHENGVTTINGLLLTIGNYINILFHSIDKQFVLAFYNTNAFAMYSFAMSMQNIITIFITALANPFYTRIAKNDIDARELVQLRNILIVFGAYSGGAYFAVSFIVKNYIPNYMGALDIITNFFAVFPAMAVINVLYVNLYKLRHMLKKYIFVLVGMLAVVGALNGIVVLFELEYRGIAFATMISYYIWLLYSQVDFIDIKLSTREYIYILGFFFLYFSLQRIGNDIIGFLTYAVVITIWSLLIYKNTIVVLFKNLIGRLSSVKFCGR